MKRYVCSKCGYIENTNILPNDFICPNCGSISDSFNVFEDILAENEIDAIIESVIEDSYENNNSKIINRDEEEKYLIIDKNNNVVEKNDDKCIRCGQCKKTCEKLINIKYDLNVCDKPICIGCGHCILNCPSNSLYFKNNYNELKEIIDLNEKIVVGILSPSTIISFKEIYNDKDIDIEKKLISVLKKIGFDFVFDESFGSDLLILEQTAELIKRISEKKDIPMITSTCPSANKYIEIYHPDLIENLSKCRTQDDILCAIIKKYFCEQKGFDPSKIVTVIISNCSAKMVELKEYTENIDFVITTSQLYDIIEKEKIKINSLENKEFDSFTTNVSSCGYLFQTSGGQSEAMIKTLFKIMNNNKINLDEKVFSNIRESKKIKESALIINNSKINIAIVNGMNNFEKIISNDYYKKFHYIEVMNCDEGCIGGSGQISNENIKNNTSIIKRKELLHNLESNNKVKSSLDNENLKKLYNEYLGKPLGEISLKMLYTHFKDKSDLLKK